MNKISGSIFVFEGVDHVGKTSLITEVYDRLIEAEKPVIKVSFPGREQNTLGRWVYDLHHNANIVNESIDPISIQMLHVASHINILKNKILPSLENGNIILLDRFWWSTLAYGIGDSIDRKVLNHILYAEIELWKLVESITVFYVSRKDAISDFNIKKKELIEQEYHNLVIKNNKIVTRIENDYSIKVSADKIIQAITSKTRKSKDAMFQQTFLLNLDEDGLKKGSQYPSSWSSIKPTIVYDDYWYLATERQNIFFKKKNDYFGPWTNDFILQRYKFTNAYRASDRVSQYLIRNVIYTNESYSPEDILFRILLFKIFNKIETWQYLEKTVGEICLQNYSFELFDKILSSRIEEGPIYSAAYIMPSGKSYFGNQRKHQNNLRLLELINNSGLARKIARANSLEEVFEFLLSFPTLGRFLAFQFAIDINYSELCDFSEMSFVVPGPGALRGIRKCFFNNKEKSPEDVIRWVSENQNEEFSKRGLRFQSLGGRQLQLIDCQNLFCEIDKYTRIARPEFAVGNEKRIKQTYTSNNNERIQYFYPPKWEINDKI